MRASFRLSSSQLASTLAGWRSRISISTSNASASHSVASWAWMDLTTRRGRRRWAGPGAGAAGHHAGQPGDRVAATLVDPVDRPGPEQVPGQPGPAVLRAPSEDPLPQAPVGRGDLARAGGPGTGPARCLAWMDAGNLSSLSGSPRAGGRRAPSSGRASSRWCRSGEARRSGWAGGRRSSVGPPSECGEPGASASSRSTARDGSAGSPRRMPAEAATSAGGQHRGGEAGGHGVRCGRGEPAPGAWPPGPTAWWATDRPVVRPAGRGHGRPVLVDEGLAAPAVTGALLGHPLPAVLVVLVEHLGHGGDGPGLGAAEPQVPVLARRQLLVEGQVVGEVGAAG